MTKQLEDSIGVALEAQQQYKNLLSCPLPPSPQLVNEDNEILEQEVSECVTAVNS